jgi:hypothetical protein
MAIQEALQPDRTNRKKMSRTCREDDPFGLYRKEAREQLLQAARVKYLPQFPKWVELDREVQTLFDGRSLLDAQEALLAGLALWSGTDGVIQGIRIALAMGAQHGIVRFEDSPRGPRWHLVHSGVVLLPRHGEVFDVRIDQLVGRGTVASLVKAESRRRERYLLAQRAHMTANAIRVLARIARETAVPPSLIATDYPPAQTMGEFKDNISGFIDVMPLWRIGELIMATQPMPWRKPAANPEDIAPPELKDFVL